ncbi:slit homolog 1 protein-like [Mercenaria mercenaria]|uniref:slit homolog 1 protein-like n=1 Tax=Mercenaria mercenaria TaxID=6596 RepID=UPI00234ED1DA|nr:slit homolog 1 protein-like [Mercenaria mercenaria]
MVKNTRTVYLFLVFIYLCTKYGYLKKPSEESADFVCDFNNNTLKLVIKNGFKDEQVIKCLEAYNTSETLIFSNSRLKRIPEYLDILKRLVNLDLSQNEITAVSFDTSQQMCHNLRQLVLDDNDIYVLRAGNLDCLESLEKLYLANNNLSLIENGTFSVKLKALDYVHLVNNSLTIVDSSLISKVLLSSKTYIRLNASRNRITGFTNSVNITINDIDKSTVIDIVLTHNNITTVDTNYYFKMFSVTHPFPQLLNLWNSAFDARFNPFICDCALLPLALALRKFYTMDPDNPVFSITCGIPKSLEGMLVRKVQADQFNCSVTQDCPDCCTCIKTIAIGLITDCSNTYHADDIPMTCPVADRININIKSNDMIQLSSRAYLHNVTVFDVSQCAIADIDPSIVKTLEGGINRSIFLHNNNFENIPRTFETFAFAKGQVLTIDGNPFTCDCHTLWMKKWLLSNKEHVYNQYKIICATGPGKGRAMIEVPDNNFVCQRSLTFVDILFITVGSLIGIILLFSFAACKINSIQVFMISNFNVWKTTCRKKIPRSLSYDTL